MAGGSAGSRKGCITGVVALFVLVIWARARCSSSADQDARCEQLLHQATAALKARDVELADSALTTAKEACGTQSLARIEGLERDIRYVRGLPPASQSALPPGRVEPSMPTSVPKGTWAKIPMPGNDIADTPANRLAYMTNVAAPVPGEPPINKPAAGKLLAKLRAKLAEQASIPLQSIKVSTGDGSVSVVISPGTMAHMAVRGEARAFPVCSEGIFASSMLIAETTHDEFSKVGVRSILCKSDGCTAIMDLRPTTPGGGLYGGSACLSMADMLKLAIEE